MKVLLTGATGFIGGNLALALAATAAALLLRWSQYGVPPFSI